MLLKIINYTVRSIFIVIGIVMLTGLVELPPQYDGSFAVIVGIVFILFGIYRIIIYKSQSKRYNFDVETQEDNEENT
ncbi:MAG: hypothetical protein PF588_03800 [Candidatus Kapabacteria bacterium]|jgi:hypothetical protein|nr:hypothetical protein [Candidatus Kapabacteria bacterium]